MMIVGVVVTKCRLDTNANDRFSLFLTVNVCQFSFSNEFYINKQSTFSSAFSPHFSPELETYIIMNHVNSDDTSLRLNPVGN